VSHFQNCPKGGRPRPHAFVKVAVLGGDFGLVDAFVNPVFPKDFCNGWSVCGVRLKASGMAITGTVPEPRQLSSLWRVIKSLRA
jgi:hypothetical protein